MLVGKKAIVVEVYLQRNYTYEQVFKRYKGNLTALP